MKLEKGKVYYDAHKGRFSQYRGNNTFSSAEFYGDAETSLGNYELSNAYVEKYFIDPGALDSFKHCKWATCGYKALEYNPN